MNMWQLDSFIRAGLICFIVAVTGLGPAGLRAQERNSPRTVPDASLSLPPLGTGSADRRTVTPKVATVVDARSVYKVDVANGKMVGKGYPINVTLSDIAYAPNGILYGIDFSYFYIITFDSRGKYYRANQVAGLNQYGVMMNALVCPSNSYCLAAAANSKRLFKIMIATGRATPITPSNKQFGYTSDGDLTFHEGKLYLAAENGWLIRLDPTTGTLVSGSPKRDGIDQLWGLVSTGTNKLYGFGFPNGKVKLYEINEDTGATESTVTLPVWPAGPDQVRGAAYPQ
ncbi:MAG: hypothetical protein U1E45_01105 [Geminicoccaceae bacterium]